MGVYNLYIPVLLVLMEMFAKSQHGYIIRFVNCHAIFNVSNSKEIVYEFCIISV